MTTASLDMPKGAGGRPKRDATNTETRHTRINADLADMIGWIVRVEGGSSATLLDPMIRSQIQAKYTRIKTAVEEIRRAEASARKAEHEAKKKLG